MARANLKAVETMMSRLPPSRAESRDCGMPVNSANCTCVRPAFRRSLRKLRPNISAGEEWRFDVGPLGIGAMYQVSDVFAWSDASRSIRARDRPFVGSRFTGAN